MRVRFSQQAKFLMHKKPNSWFFKANDVSIGQGFLENVLLDWKYFFFRFRRQVENTEPRATNGGRYCGHGA